MPAVNAELMFQAMKDAKADFNQVVYWSRPVSWKNQTLTPNPDTIYLMPFYNTKDAGPMVLEIPPAGEESVDHRQHRRCLADGAGGCRPGRRRQGQGRQVPHPAAGLQGESARRLHRAALGNLHRLRHPALQPQERQRRRHRQGRRLRQARQVLSAVAGGEPSRRPKFVDALDVCSTARSPTTCVLRDARPLRAARALARRATRSMIDPLKTIGIEKGKPFKPDDRDEEDSQRRRARSACLARTQVRGRFLAAVQRGHSLGAARQAGCGRRPA